VLGARNSIGIFLKGIQFLKEGIIWRIDNGRSTRIWADPWLPRSWTRGPITPRCSNLLSSVDELIDLVTGKWDALLIS
jgi:hypothetical protein